MLHHQNGTIDRNLADQVNHASDILVPHALRRLIEQHQLGIERQGGGDFERALAAIGQFHRHRFGEGREVHRRQQRHRAVIQLVKGLLRFPEMKRGTELALQADAHILQHRKTRKRRGNLKRAHDAAPRNLRGFFTGDINAIEMDRARRRRVKMREQIEGRGLARAIGPDQRMDRAALDLEINVADGDEAFELFGEPTRFEDVFSACRHHGQH